SMSSVPFEDALRALPAARGAQGVLRKEPEVDNQMDNQKNETNEQLETTQAQGGRTGFDALDVSVDFVENVAPLIERIHSLDRSLADQARRAAQSLVLNLAEGRKRRGRDRSQCFRVASGGGEEGR